MLQGEALTKTEEGKKLMCDYTSTLPRKILSILDMLPGGLEALLSICLRVKDRGL